MTIIHEDDKTTVAIHDGGSSCNSNAVIVSESGHKKGDEAIRKHRGAFKT